LLLLTLLGVGLLWLSPTIVAKTGLLGYIVDSTTSQLDGTIDIRSASLGWFSPLTLWDVEVRDADGGLVVQVPKVVGDRSLLKLLFDSGDMGSLRLEEPTLRLVLGSEESNAERVFAAWLTSDEQLSLDTTAVNLRIVDAEATVIDEVQDRTWHLEDLQFAAEVPRHLSQATQVTMSADVDPQADRGHIEVTAELRWNEVDHVEPVSSGRVSLVTKKLPLEMGAWWVQRLSPGAELSGRLTSTLQYEWTPEATGTAPKTKIEGKVHTDNLVLAGPWLGNDRLRLASLDVPCRIAQVGSRVEIAQLDVDSDLGKVTYQGAIDTSAGVLLSLENETYQLEGKLDLARLSQMLPETLRVREGTKITEGDITIRLVSAQRNNAATWTGRIETNRLTAVNGTRQITWDDPLLVTFNAHQGDQGVLVDELRCDASFLELEAAGEPDYFSISASYNLQKLSDELRQFFDLRDVQLAGDGWSYLTWQQNEDGTFEADGETQVRDLVAVLPGRRPLREANLIALLESTGQGTSINKLTQLKTASLRVDSGLDRVAIRLTQPVSNPQHAKQWPVSVEARGQLANWIPRVEPLVGSLEGWNVSGQTQLQATGNLAGDQLELTSSDISVNNLHVNVHGVVIDEPRLTAKVAGDWNGDGQIRLAGASMNSATLSLATNNLVALIDEQGVSELSGDLVYQGDLRLLQRWLSDPASPASWNTGGTLDGTLNVRRNGPTTDVSWSAKIKNLVAQQTGGDLWHQRDVESTGQCQFNRTTDRLSITQLALHSDALALSASGGIDRVSGPLDMKLRGNIDYDLPKVAALLRPYLGDDVQLVGKQQRSFSLEGPLQTPDKATPGTLEASLVGRLNGTTSVGWERGNLYGFELGPGSLDGQLARGRLSLSALDLPLSGGRLNANPLFVLAPGTAEMYLKPGPLLSRVKLTPEMCRDTLMYIVPVLADVARAEGSFSVDLSGCRVPLSDPTGGDLAGQFTIHDVKISGGPLVRELGILLQRPSEAQLTRESKVAFRMVGGRIYHRDLELVFPELTIRTYGSVGLDHSLALMAEMPVPPKWIGNNTFGDAVRNQIIQLPIGGTLEQPKIDQRALQKASAQFVRNTATNVLRNELNNQLDRLLRRNP